MPRPWHPPPLQTALALAPTVMQPSIRSGCVHLTATSLLSEPEMQRMQREVQGGLAGVVARQLSRSQAAAGQPCKLLVSWAEQGAVATVLPVWHEWGICVEL